MPYQAISSCLDHQAGLDPRLKSKDGRTAAEVALMSGHMEVYDMLSPKHMGALQQPTSEEENRGAAAATKSPLHAAAVRSLSPPNHAPIHSPGPLS